MVSFASPPKFVVDSIHGDIHLTPEEWGVVNTASFQRLRHIKQLGMGHFTYPNATHTRFAHSLGVFGIMVKVLDAVERCGFSLSAEKRENLRLAALLHDIGHYPYSHVMETIDSVLLTEEFISSGGEKRTLDTKTTRYPGHEEVGRQIVTSQQDLISAIGGAERAKAIADIFTRDEAADPQFSKLIHGSLDMDRLDYLLRDSRAAGVPYGSIDIHYLLNNVRVDPNTGVVGVSKKALPAAEQFLLARYFMHRAVYYHKTTVAMEETCRQLLRRVRDKGKYGVPQNGQKVLDRVATESLGGFTDAFVDGVMRQALVDDDENVKKLAQAFVNRRPPKLLKEVSILPERGELYHPLATFKMNCQHRLGNLCEEKRISPTLFLFWEAKPFDFEVRGPSFGTEEVKKIVAEGEGVFQEEESIKVFVDDSGEPKSIMDIDDSIMQACAGRRFLLARLYVVSEEKNLVDDLRKEVSMWDQSS